MSTFVWLSQRIINLDQVVTLAREPDANSEYLLHTAGMSTFGLDPADADVLRQAMHAARWLPPGGPGPLTAELVACVRELVHATRACGYDCEQIEVRDATAKARALLARVEGPAP